MPRLQNTLAHQILMGATTADSVTIETANGALTIPRAEVLRIEFGAGEATAPPVVAPAAAAPPPAWEPPAAIASPPPVGRGWAGYVNAFAGSRSMNSTWEPVASQGQFALETTFLPPGWDVGVAVDLTSSYASGKVEDDPDLENVTFEGSTSEFDVGARFVADLNRGVVPVTASVGAGLCSMTATFSGEEDGQVIEDSGSGTGYWLSAGVHLRMLEHLNLGLSMRVSRADVEVFGIRSNAGGGQLGFTAGVSFGFPKRSR